MRHYLHIAALSLSMAASTLAAAENVETGLAPLSVTDARTDRPLDGFVWYPTAQTEGAEIHHGNAVWKGISAIADAPPMPGQRPLVVLSHGMYGNAMNQSWLADGLVDAGFIVAAIHHPGTSTWMRDADQARMLWDRPRDISRLIDHMLSDPDLSAQVDADRIYMAGHSLGGFTAVALAGGRFDAAGYRAKCSSAVGELVCGVFERWNVAQTPQDVAQMEQDLSDPRIRGFAVFDLGGTQSFSESSLAAIDTPMLVFGAPLATSGLDLDLESRTLVRHLPAQTTRYLESETLSHFDFLGVCNPGAEAILAEEEPGDEIICQQGGAAREAHQAMILREVLASFGGGEAGLAN
ncbi:hypothetical protein [uncultured Sulfitobacter sp.]|uniref:alpha/beta hydrolase family protein n=1 Tax=uncultured Sulfitobacter sp. TaxID=191468 RepID=UPI0026021D82|nr:hypothetical protein [uncultured Sulfitobacter sp.]